MELQEKTELNKKIIDFSQRLIIFLKEIYLERHEDFKEINFVTFSTNILCYVLSMNSIALSDEESSKKYIQDINDFILITYENNKKQVA